MKIVIHGGFFSESSQSDETKLKNDSKWQGSLLIVIASRIPPRPVIGEELRRQNILRNDMKGSLVVAVLGAGTFR